LTNLTHARKEVLALKEIILCTGTTKKHDPKNVVYNHYKTLKMVPPFEHEIREEEEIFHEARSYEEVLAHVAGTP
jgi:hypothetical protein